MTDTELDAIRKRADAAKPGPWRPENLDRPDPIIVVEGMPMAELNADDARFIAAARTDVPALLAEIERLHEQLRAAALRTSKDEEVHTTGTTHAEAGLEPPAVTRPIYRSQAGPPQLLAVVERPECDEWREQALLRARAEKAEAERDRLKEHWRCQEHGEFGSHQWGCPDCVASMRRALREQTEHLNGIGAALDAAGVHGDSYRECIAMMTNEIKELRERLNEWHRAAHETAVLRGVLIEFWEAAARAWKDPDRIETARKNLMATAGRLVARKEKGELI